MSLKPIHDWLNRQERFIDGKPLWRLIWSENITEKRFGKFQDFYGSIFIREYVGIREARKYNYVSERWILERFNPGKVDKYDISGDGGGSYEPLWVFESGKGDYLEPTLKAVQFLIEFARQDTRMTPAERQAWADKAEDEEFKKCYEEIGASTSDPIPSLLHTASGVSMHVKGEKKCLIEL